MKKTKLWCFALISTILIVGLFCFALIEIGFCSVESSNYRLTINIDSSGTISSSSGSYDIQAVVGQAIIGSTGVQYIFDSRFGFLPILSEPAPTGNEFEIYDIQAFSFSKRTEILASVWQNNNDPYFTWKVKSYVPSALIVGYSVALDAEPDETIDTIDAYYDGFIVGFVTDGKHTFYVKAATTGNVWGDVYSFEFWVDTKEPDTENLEPPPGSLTIDNTPTISLNLSDAHSGLDLDSLKLYIDDSPFSFTYENGLLVSTPTTALPDGAKTVRIQANDFAGNLLNRIWGFTIDSNLPTGSILLNGGEGSTNYARVRLSLEASDQTTEVTQMIISNDGVFDTESWENFQPDYTDWILYEPQKIGLKRVYCRFKDEAGNISDIYEDSIMLTSASIDTVITSGPLSPTQEVEAAFSFRSSLDEALFSYKLDGQNWTDWAQDTTANFSGLAPGNHIFSVKSAKDMNGDGTISLDEEDLLPAQWTWIIQTEQVPEDSERILYWRTE
jgi:hypothetical protein